MTEPHDPSANPYCGLGCLISKPHRHAGDHILFDPAPPRPGISLRAGTHRILAADTIDTLTDIHTLRRKIQDERHALTDAANEDRLDERDMRLEKLHHTESQLDDDYQHASLIALVNALLAIGEPR